MPLAVDVSANVHSSAPLKSSSAQPNGTVKHIIDPVVLAKPNLALWVTKDHKCVFAGNEDAKLIIRLYQTEEPYPECPPDQCVIHVVSAARAISVSSAHSTESHRNLR
jgi:L-iditol 2-dehydrogenase